MYFLEDEVLYSRIERTRGLPEHTTVWHLCYEYLHMACAGKLGQVAIVNFEVPEIPDTEQEGLFLMRLHPLTRHLHVIDDNTGGIWLPLAVSFPHATVWHIPLPPRI